MLAIQLILFFLLVSFITATAESAFRIVNPKKLKEFYGDNRNTEKLLDLLEEKTQLFSTIVTIKSIATSFLFTLISYKLVKLQIFESYLNFLFIFIINSVVLFLFVNLLPKYYAYNTPEKSSLFVYLPIKLLCLFTKPFISLLMIFLNPVLTKVGNNFGKVINNVTAKEIRDIVETSHKTGLLEHYETKIIRSALSIDELPVSSIITPRVDIESISVDTSVRDTIDIMIKEEYSRLPVYEDNVDNIIGVVHIKDLLKVKKTDKNNANKSVKSFMRKVFHVPETKKITALLREMQAKRLQMAIVSDEYGGTSGLVTMEDILEQIVGQIRDEHDYDESLSIVEIDKNTFIVDAMASVEEINNCLGVELPNTQTIGRLFFDSSDEIPKLNQIKDIGNVRIKVHEIDGIRVQKFTIKKILSGITQSNNEDNSSEKQKN